MDIDTGLDFLLKDWRRTSGPFRLEEDEEEDEHDDDAE
jgi:hypothetical protein